MECRFVQNPPFPVQYYEGALNTVGIDLGISAGGVLGWAVHVQVNPWFTHVAGRLSRSSPEGSA